MKNHIYLTSILLFLCFTGKMSAQIYSFEDNQVPSAWSITRGDLSVSDQKYKLGHKSLKVSWTGESKLTMSSVQGLTEASEAVNGGITTWIYNELPIEKYMVFEFRDQKGELVCSIPFLLNFSGWRCIWAKFREDMGMSSQARVYSVDILLPETKEEKNIYLDYLEFTKNVSWQKMSDAQYNVNRTDFSLIHDFIGYRNTVPDLSKVILSHQNQIGIKEIADRLTDWYLGKGKFSGHPLLKVRQQEEDKFIKKGLQASEKIHAKYDKSNSPVGNGLFPLYAPAVIDNERVGSFPEINKNILIPLALDYRKHGNKQSLEKALFIYDWFNDQGWADGSAMGTLCFEKLRSSGYFHSFYLLKEHLTPDKLERELKTMKWFTMFGCCYQQPAHPGEVADNLRALALPKLVYALSLTDEKERQHAMTAYTAYMNNALEFGPGYFGTIKADYSGYHHRGPYNSAYYPHALYAASLIAYLLHDTPYALSDASMSRLKQALLTYRFFSANIEVPAGTTGRFPDQQEVLHILLPAYAYIALSQKQVDEELTAAFKTILDNNPSQVEAYAATVNSNLTYTSTMGEMELVAQLAATHIKEEGTQEGALFMPYSGLMVIKSKNHHFNIKGFSKYVWDYESSGSENVYGRYLSYGQIEHFGLKDKVKSFHAEHPLFDWNYISGTTAKVLPKDKLHDTTKSREFHRNFSDESFLCGVGKSKDMAMFSMKLHDITFDQTFRAYKSVFAFDNVLVCMGSGIQNADTEVTTVTTIAQSLGTKNEVDLKQIKGGSMLTLDGLHYAMKDCEPHLIYNDAFRIAYINHGKAPQKDTYLYYIVYDENRRLAERLLSKRSPVRVIAQDEDAHIIKHIEKEITYAAIFNASKKYDSTPVESINIPLSYIFREEKDRSCTLMFCEPDMRRPTGINMGKLTEEEVLQPEKPFDTELILNGVYEMIETNPSVGISYQNGKTIIKVTTIRGENYTLNLLKK